MERYLPVIWAAVIGTAVAMYVVLDGFDVGIGIYGLCCKLDSFGAFKQPLLILVHGFSPDTV